MKVPLRCIIFVLRVASAATATIKSDANLASQASMGFMAPATSEDGPGAAASTSSVSSDGALDAPPVLPEVSSFMGSAAETVKGINSQASILEARIAQTQMANEAKLARQKAVFEQKLHAQDGKNRAMVGANAQISIEIDSLKKQNAELRNSGSQLRKKNKQYGKEMKVVSAKLKEAQNFVKELLKVADDQGAEDLLQELGDATHPAHALHRFPAQRAKEVNTEVFDEDDGMTDESEGDDDVDGDVDTSKEEDDDDEEQGASFLALKSTVRRTEQQESEDAQIGSQLADVEAELAAIPGGSDEIPGTPADPTDLLHVLSSGLSSLVTQEKTGEAQLRSMFLTKFKEGTSRRKKLTAQQKSLNATRASLASEQSQLKESTASIVNVHQRLKKLGHFMQSLSHFLLAPEEEAAQLFNTLPDATFLRALDSVDNQK